MEEPAAALIWPAIALVFAAVFSGLWRADPMRKSLLGFAAGFFALFLAMGFRFAFPALSTAAPTAIVHSLLCISVIAIVWGATERINQRAPVGGMLAVSVVSCVLLFAALAWGETTAALIVQNGTSGLLFAIGAVVLWMARPINVLDRILVWTMSGIAMLGLVRPVLLIILDVDIEQIVQQQVDYHTPSLIAITLLTIILGLTLVAIAIHEAIEIWYRGEKVDPVSSFHSRPKFDALCEGKVTSASRLGMPVSLAICEVDRIGDLRKDWGDDAVDLSLRDISEALRACRRDGDIVGRVGEGQFGILLIGMGAGSALKLTRDVQQTIEHKYQGSRPGSLKLTIGCGIAQAREAEQYHELSQRAFESLAQARRHGTNCIVVNGARIDRIGFEQPDTGKLTTYG